MHKLRSLLFASSILVSTPAYAIDMSLASPPYTGVRLGNMQCLITNTTNHPLYILGEWIECDTRGSVTASTAFHLQAHESTNMMSIDSRACRCFVEWSGESTDITLLTASGSTTPLLPVPIATAEPEDEDTYGLRATWRYLFGVK